VLDSAFNQIVSGGVDGRIAVWNQFSGVLKFAIDLPSPIDEANPSAMLSHEQCHVRRKISDVLFHPYFSNLVCVM